MVGATTEKSPGGNLGVIVPNELRHPRRRARASRGAWRCRSSEHRIPVGQVSHDLPPDRVEHAVLRWAQVEQALVTHPAQMFLFAIFVVPEG